MGEPIRGGVENDMSRGVAWAVEDFELAFAQHDLISHFQPLIRAEGLDGREAKGGALTGQGTEQKLVIRMGPQNGYPQPCRQGASRADVIEMAMGQQNLGEGYATLVDEV